MAASWEDNNVGYINLEASSLNKYWIYSVIKKHSHLANVDYNLLHSLSIIPVVMEQNHFFSSLMSIFTVYYEKIKTNSCLHPVLHIDVNLQTSSVKFIRFQIS